MLAERLSSGAFPDKKVLPGMIHQGRKNRQIFSLEIKGLQCPEMRNLSLPDLWLIPRNS
jgi:hypothetical protein